MREVQLRRPCEAHASGFSASFFRAVYITKRSCRSKAKMDPTDPASFNHRTELLSTGRTYHFVDHIPESYSGPAASAASTILCVHGFPDIWYGWRYQIGPWVRAGYRVVVPDMLGYGGTDKPRAAEEYSTRRLCADLAALLDVVGVQKAIVIGHDWGSYIAGRFALWHPDRLLALGLFSIPFPSPLKKYIPLEGIVERVPNYAYQLYFASPESTKEIEANLERFLRAIYEIEVHEKSIELRYVSSQMRDMNGPLSYYRTTKVRFEEEQAAQLPDRPPANLPVLHIWGAKDLSATPSSLAKMRVLIPKLEEKELKNEGHWIMVQAKDEVTRGVLDWLGNLKLAMLSKL
ncbi:alpha/beta-hydrolase [Lactarius hatsudake]|nr:alpha/beta-hydrolase [Lactarius hatsudake]